ncbi:MAG TPA: LysR substrate-binding domain-containing protein [Steroidobacteraceae bacterium]|jgi:DNA-binding transcriptional LysR family regulator|nr:LysR substrate-binding domain-containing protein [Steroidobacteraceae bacterium]
MADRLSALRLFLRVARAGSFSRAAGEVGLSQPTASRIIATLEKEVGATLFTRSTRALSLTEAGAEYLARVEPAVAALDEADHVVRGTDELRGVLRVASSSSFTEQAIIPKLDEFLTRNPKLRIVLLVNDQRQALITEGVDVAFRFGSLDDSRATARRLGSIERVLVASPTYLARAGGPKGPADLNAHAIIAGPMGTDWTLEKAGRRVSVHLQGRLVVSSNEATVAAAVAGLGIATTGMIASHKAIANGTLVRLLPDWQMGSVDVHAVFPAGRAAKAAARALADHVTGAFRA